MASLRSSTFSIASIWQSHRGRRFHQTTPTQDARWRYDKTMNPLDLMAEAEELKKKWHVALGEVEKAKKEGRPTVEIAKLVAAEQELLAASRAKRDAALAANLAEQKK